MASLLPIATGYLDRPLTLRPGDRLHRLVARLHDTHIDDLTAEAIAELEAEVDSLRRTHADGSKIDHPSIDPLPVYGTR